MLLDKFIIISVVADVMVTSTECKLCNTNHIAVARLKNKNQITGVSEIKIKDKPVLITDTSILFAVINGYSTVSKIKEALDSAYFKDNKDQKIVFGGRTEGNLRARLKVLDMLGLVFTNHNSNKRIPEYTVTNLGIAVQSVFMASLDLFSSACSDCISSRMQSIVQEVSS